MSWHENLIEDDEQLRDILHQAKKIAVVGIKDESKKNEAAHKVPEYLKDHGYEIVPVSPQYENVFGVKSLENLSDLDEPVDTILMFRAPQHIPSHAKEVLEMKEKPQVVWMQSGIRNMQAAHELAAAGIKVVQDHCFYRDHLRLVRHD